MNLEEAKDYLLKTCDPKQLEAVMVILESRKSPAGRKIEFTDKKHEYYRKYMKAYREKNREKITEYQRQYQKRYRG